MTVAPSAAPAGAPAIVVEGLTLRRGAETVEGLSFTVRAGESAALLGDDQELLSLLLRVCAGLDRPEAGTVRVAGVEVTTATREALLALRAVASYVSGEGSAFSNMSLLANVMLPLRYHTREPDAAIEERAMSLLAQLGLAEEAHLRAAAVLPALRKRVAYARALARGPRILFLEDPSALLDPEGRLALQALSTRLRAEGVTLLLADDDVELAARLAGRALLVRRGRLEHDGPFETLPESFRALWTARRPSARRGAA